MGIDSERATPGLYREESSKSKKFGDIPSRRPKSRVTSVEQGGRLSRASTHRYPSRPQSTLNSRRKNSNASSTALPPAELSTAPTPQPVPFAPPHINLDSSEDEEDDEKKAFPGPNDPNRVHLLYASACRRLVVTPSKLFTRSIENGVVNVSYQGLGPDGIKAISIALVTSMLVTELDLQGNNMGPTGMKYIADMVHANGVLKILDVSDNNLGTEGAEWLAKMMEESDALCKLSAANNNFDEEAAIALAPAIKKNSTIRVLDLSKNLFHEEGAAILGKALGDNEVLESVNLSWNHIRNAGILGVAEGIKENISIKNLNLCMNGLGRDGTEALGHALKQNRTLRTLTMRSCRINMDGLLLFFTRMAGNETLKSIDLADNPITNEDAIIVLRTILCNPSLAIENMGFENLVVSKEFLEVRDQIQEFRPDFKVSYGGIMRVKGIPKKFLKEMMTPKVGDPLEMLVRFIKDNGLRLMDLFVRLDTDKSCTISRDEFRFGVVNAGLNFSEHQMDSLIEKLDADGDGEIDFGELVDAYRNYQRKLLRKAGLDSTGGSRANSRSTSPTEYWKEENKAGGKSRILSRQNSRPSSRPSSPFPVSMTGPLGNPNELALNPEHLRASEDAHRPSIHEVLFPVPVLLNATALRDAIQEAKDQTAADDDR